MSFFGRNIKKIRGVKGLSQKAFAELFDLKRPTLGAYEEGRSEPKIETIIKIANYFSITIDSMLTSDLTVNELLRFKEDLIVEPDAITENVLTRIPMISGEHKKLYLQYHNNSKFIGDLPSVLLPIEQTKELRAFVVNNLEMTSNDKGLYPKDVVFGEKIIINKIDEINEGEVVLVVSEDDIILRKLFITDKDFLVLKAAHKNIEDKIVAKEAVKEIWLVKYSFIKRLPQLGDLVEDKLLFLEQELLKLKGKI